MLVASSNPYITTVSCRDMGVERKERASTGRGHGHLTHPDVLNNGKMERGEVEDMDHQRAKYATFSLAEN